MSTHGEAVGETAGDTEAVGRTVDGGEDEDHGGAPAKSHQLFSGTWIKVPGFWTISMDRNGYDIYVYIYIYGMIGYDIMDNPWI
jgi:hypothetical protein